MSLATVARRSASLVPQMRAAAARSMATGTPSYTGTVYKESEHARENLYFSKEDEKSLRKLLGKVKASSDASCKSAAEHASKETAALTAIVGKYKLAPADVEALLKWRHSNEF